MRRRAAGPLLALAFALALAACSTDSKPQNPNIYPADYKSEIIATLKEFFKTNDTVKVSGAFVSDPVLEKVGSDQRYSACVRYTAHGSYRNMVGTATRIAYFFGGHVTQLVPAGKDQCVNVAYKPFPELDKFCVGTGCK